ncbi:MAG: alkaline shock response membrane anchor protein AmaP [Clostridia bacterium]|nr:alkaline shock response membrane anchor protein AmaP [Clostridia bacterium]
MKILDRIGLALFSMLILTISIVLLLISFGFVDISIFSILIEKVLQATHSTYILQGVCVALTLLSLKCLFFNSYSKGSEEGVMMQNNNGKLLITKTTLENIVTSTLKEFPNIKKSELSVKFGKEDNINISIIINVEEGTIIKDLSTKIQSKVKKNIKETTNIDLGSVDIEIESVEIKKSETEEDKKNKEGK